MPHIYKYTLDCQSFTAVDDDLLMTTEYKDGQGNLIGKLQFTQLQDEMDNTARLMNFHTQQCEDVLVPKQNQPDPLLDVENFHEQNIRQLLIWNYRWQLQRLAE